MSKKNSWLEKNNSFTTNLSDFKNDILILDNSGTSIQSKKYFKSKNQVVFKKLSNSSKKSNILSKKINHFKIYQNNYQYNFKNKENVCNLVNIELRYKNENQLLKNIQFNEFQKDSKNKTDSDLKESLAILKKKNLSMISDMSFKTESIFNCSKSSISKNERISFEDDEINYSSQLNQKESKNNSFYFINKQKHGPQKSQNQKKNIEQFEVCPSLKLKQSSCTSQNSIFRISDLKIESLENYSFISALSNPKKELLLRNACKIKENQSPFKSQNNSNFLIKKKYQTKQKLFTFGKYKTKNHMSNQKDKNQKLKLNQILLKDKNLRHRKNSVFSSIKKKQNKRIIPKSFESISNNSNLSSWYKLMFNRQKSFSSNIEPQKKPLKRTRNRPKNVSPVIFNRLSVKCKSNLSSFRKHFAIKHNIRIQKNNKSKQKSLRIQENVKINQFKNKSNVTIQKRHKCLLTQDKRQRYSKSKSEIDVQFELVKRNLRFYALKTLKSFRFK